MYSSGTSGVGTSGAGNVVLIDLSARSGPLYSRLVISNKGTTDGFFSVDGGTTWGYIPGATTAAVGTVEWWGKGNSSVLMKRAGGTDMTNVFAFADWIEF